MKELEKRMYFFVPYQLTGIQQGIQCGHAVEQYAHKYKDDIEYIDFVENWKTWVVLNGGTTNSNLENPGTLNVIHRSLIDNYIKCKSFYEPDLNDALTAICFICDERVFNKEKYPDFEDLMLKSVYEYQIVTNYDQWLEFIGGEKNLFLRELLKGKRLA